MSAGIVSARDAILGAVRDARPPSAERPEPLWPAARPANGLSRRDAFMAAATAAGAVVTSCGRDDLPRVLRSAAGDGSVLSYVDGVPSTVSSQGDPHVLATLASVVCESPLGVAENGAVWLATSDSVLRAALFLAASVVIVLAEERLVDDLHEAYERIDVRAHSFGAFIAGPSKTADIEQSLVIGAHGPKALTLVLVPANPSDDTGTS